MDLARSILNGPTTTPKIFEQTKHSQLTVSHCWNQSNYALSEESDEPKSRLSAKKPFLASSSPKLSQIEPHKSQPDEKI